MTDRIVVAGINLDQSQRKGFLLVGQQRLIQGASNDTLTVISGLLESEIVYIVVSDTFHVRLVRNVMRMYLRLPSCST